MTLTNAFYGYLTSEDQSASLPSLSHALANAEYWLEHSLLEQYIQKGTSSEIITVPHSRYLGRRGWVGFELPTDGAAGDIWLDMRELMPMMLIPSEPHPWREVDPIIQYRPLYCWIACRPVARWQYQAYLATNADNSSEFSLEITEETHSATNLKLTNAKNYARWFGKMLPDTIDWQAVQEFLPEVVIDEMWLGQDREWSNARSYYDDEMALVITRETLTQDPDELLQAYEAGNASDPKDELVFSLETASPKIGFRTLVNMQFGLQKRE
ncbi:hypothetical protein [Nostoc sp. CMAA1605]|uniref:hypothetical protein n=1 Tax=Nostoc sp. CMAA1605 TaxID=2055159 RepID=UPI001F1B635E|nr:hypothetical protein [Nostoc sp. CMAA1605]